MRLIGLGRGAPLGRYRAGSGEVDGPLVYDRG
jgi:hypothetical protein